MSSDRRAPAARFRTGVERSARPRVARIGRSRFRWARVVMLALAVGAVTLALGAATASASLLGSVSSFGSQGSGAGQFQNPTAMASDQASGNVYVADSGNNRVEKFSATGSFIAAWGWGVTDGNAQSEVCTSNCQAGIAGSGAGQLSGPRSIATSSTGKVFVGDNGNSRVEEFNADGNFLATIDGTNTPQGHFQCLGGVAVDQSGNLWVTDSCTNNVTEFDSHGHFLRQWNDQREGPGLIAVDSTNGAVYVIDNFGSFAERYTLTGTWMGVVDPQLLTESNGSFAFTAPSALALDPNTGNLYVDHSSNGGSSDVTVYDHNGVKLDDIGLSQTNSQGLTFSSLPGGAGKPGQRELYVSDASNNNVTVFQGQSTPGAPLVTSESANSANPNGMTTAQLGAGIVPLGSDTSCNFQFVSNSDFLASGYANATSVPCAPSDLGSGFAYQAATANLSGLTLGTVYHFRVVASSSAGTTTGADQEFQAGPGFWADNFRCPVDDPAMLAANFPDNVGFCLGSNSTHGSITLGNITTSTGATDLQSGLVLNENTGVWTFVPPSGGVLVVDPVQLNTPVGPVTAVTESAGTPSNFCLFCGVEVGQPILTLPIKIHLENPVLGPSCFIGSDQNPIVLNPENTDVSNLRAPGGLITFFDAQNGALDPGGQLLGIGLHGLVQGDNTFSVPGATGCGPNDSLDAAVNAVAGLPSPSGNNNLVLDDASSTLVGPEAGVPNNTIWNAQQFAAFWHSAFG